MSFHKINRRVEHPRRADKSAVGAVNRPLRCLDDFDTCHYGSCAGGHRGPDGVHRWLDDVVRCQYGSSSWSSTSRMDGWARAASTSTQMRWARKRRSWGSVRAGCKGKKARSSLWWWIQRLM